MSNDDWIKRQLSAANRDASKMPDWKHWGSEIENQDTTDQSQATRKEPSEE